MNIVAQPSSGPPTVSSAGASHAGGSASVTVSAFLDQVAGVLRQGLPARLWVEATVIAVRPSTHGHAIELVDSAPVRGTPASLRAFLSSASLVAIRQDLGLLLDPTLLVGLTTVLLIEPGFSPRWGLSARVVGLARAAETSLRQRLLEQAVMALQRERLWDRQRKMPVPRDVTRIAVIHPPSSAGWADVGHRLDRWKAAGLVVVRSLPIPFEGDGAATGLIGALGDAARTWIDGTPPDLLVILRGGGARAGLTLFDDPAIARAVCLCPVPVVTGIGHAIDVSLTDRVAFRSAPTPSLAVTLVGALMADAARRAFADQAAILAAADQATSAAEERLAVPLQRLVAASQRRCADAATTLAACWSALLTEAVRRREELGRRCDAVDGLLGLLLTGAPRLIESHARQGRSLTQDSLDHAFRLLSRHDAGTALFEALGHAARGRVERMETALGMAWDAACRASGHRALDADADLGRLEAVIAGSDIGATLQRGFALVTGPCGELLSTRIQAVAASRLTLTFADGVIEAVPVSFDARA